MTKTVTFAVDYLGVAKDPWGGERIAFEGEATINRKDFGLNWNAALETGGGVHVRWMRNGAFVEIMVEDEGPGLPSTSNLFVPFFTTKPGGSGIGLVLSRQIAEAHGGSLTLNNRVSARGCEARLRLPL